MWVAFANAKAIDIFFCKNISKYTIFNDQSFNDILTNGIISLNNWAKDIFLGEGSFLSAF